MLTDLTMDQAVVAAILVIAFALFAWGRWRYDVVAFAALLAAVLTGLVPVSETFSGFSHPATITVAFVLIISRSLMNSGATDLIARYLLPQTDKPAFYIAAVCGVAGVLSSFMNNVGALALMMPVAVQAAQRAQFSPGVILMPLSFASILGGLVTLIGTPPNIIIATYRAEETGQSFAMFDFAPVGGLVALAGIAFVAIFGWKLIPIRRSGDKSGDLFEIEAYVTEGRVLEESKACGMPFLAVDNTAHEHDIVLIGVIRRGRRYTRPHNDDPLQVNDILIFEGAPDAIDKFIGDLQLKIVGTLQDESMREHMKHTELVEAVVTARSRLEGRTAENLRLPIRFGVNLLAVSRQGKPYRGRLRSFRFRAGDVVLLHGEAEKVTEAMTTLNCLPLAQRRIAFGKRRLALATVGIFGLAIAVATIGLMNFPIALGLAVLAVAVLNIVSPREIYESVDWSVIVLLGALLPVGHALQTTGTTDLIGDAIVSGFSGGHTGLILAVLIVITMLLSAVLNNAATAIIMAPIAVAIANGMNQNIDAYLMAVAVGASCAFLTPISHQNNTLVMGPGGYRFGDYWRLGLPLSVLIVALSVPMLMWIWPV